MCGSMVDIQSPTTEIRQGKKEERKNIETTGIKYNGLPITMDGHVGCEVSCTVRILCDLYFALIYLAANNYR